MRAHVAQRFGAYFRTAFTNRWNLLFAGAGVAAALVSGIVPEEWPAGTEFLRRALDEGQFEMRFQPIVDLATNEVCGYEALARFPAEVGWTPDRWFAAADHVGMGTALESAAVHAALRLLPRIGPFDSLAINVSAGALLSSTSIPELFTGPEGHGGQVHLSPGCMQFRTQQPAKPGMADKGPDAISRLRFMNQN